MAESEGELSLLMKVKEEKVKKDERSKWKSWLKAQHSENKDQELDHKES